MFGFVEIKHIRIILIKKLKKKMRARPYEREQRLSDVQILSYIIFLSF